ncbi:MAG: translation initiation factor IF-2 [Deltaproteobacteria bacterium]
MKTEEKKEEKKGIEEKRVKATVIRRRAAKAPAPVAAESLPVEMPEKPLVAAMPPEEDKEGGKKPKTKAAGEKKSSGKKASLKKEDAHPEADLMEEAVEEQAVPAIPASEALPEAEVKEKPAEEMPLAVEGKVVVEEKPAIAKKEVKIFQKETELKKFFTRPPQKKGRGYQAKEQKSRSVQAQSQLRPLKKTEITTPKAQKRVVRISDAISVGDLSQRLGVKAGDIIKKLMSLGIMATVNQFIDVDAVTLVAQDYEYEVENVTLQEEDLLRPAEAVEGGVALKSRPPVVTVMGHVDHGKTSLLDAIRKTNVVSGEAGGITQHIGAYHVHLEKGDVTFLDTPGHEAFTAMRARGAKVTDIVILVVAADDGVMPQTIEAINHAKAANVPIIVAINKIDLPGADPGRIKQALSGYGLVSEEWGGETIFVEVSAKKGIRIKELLEMVLLQSEVLELKANPESHARGVIVEAKLDKGRGPVSTVLIQDGVLRVGDVVVSGMHSGRVRAMINDWGKRVTEAGASMPIEILGLSGVPEAGDVFVVLKDEATARQISAIRQRKSIDKDRLKTAKVSLADLSEKISRGEVKELNLIIKSDVQGSIEAIKESLGKLSTDAVKIKTIHSGVGGINEGDCMLAAASNAIIIGFNVRPEAKAAQLAEKESIDVRLYTIIYNLVDDIKNAMEGMLAPVVTEEVIGRAEIRDVFRISKAGIIAGCYVLDGKAERGAKVRLIRDSVVIYEGRLSSLKRFKDDVKEVNSGYECGMSIEGYNDIKVGDIIEMYTVRQEAARL